MGIFGEFEFGQGIPIFYTASRTNSLRIFQTKQAQYKALYTYSQSGDTGCNCEEILFTPHTNCTHLETERHVSPNGPTPMEVQMKLADEPLLTCLALNAIIKDNRICSFEFFNTANTKIDAILIKTGWLAKKLADGQFDLNGSDPPSITVELIDRLFDLWPELKICMVDLPTIDPESDRGKLLAHKRFFARNGLGIVEMLNVQDNVRPGLYLVSLNMSVFESDASPCSPIIYPVSSK
jgi:kynurenine formamidase